MYIRQLLICSRVILFYTLLLHNYDCVLYRDAKQGGVATPPLHFGEEGSIPPEFEEKIVFNC